MRGVSPWRNNKLAGALRARSRADTVSKVLWRVAQPVRLESYSTRRPHQQVPVHWEESAPAPFKRLAIRITASLTAEYRSEWIVGMWQGF